MLGASLMSVSLPEEAIALLSAGLLGCLWMIWHGYLVGFRRREIRHWGRLVATGDDAKGFGILFIVLGCLLAVALVVGTVLISRR
jgi:hypothetical protein